MGLIESISELREEEAISIAEAKIREGVDAVRILDEIRSAMEVVGKRFESGEYFIPDLVMAGEVVRSVSEIVRPSLQKQSKAEKQGKVLIGTVAGDIHDIGKDIVTFMLDVSGFDVLDLGIDVPVEMFVEKTKEFHPQVVGLSGFLTLAFESMKNTVEALERAGLREGVKVMIGGGQIDEEVQKYVHADAYGKDAVAAIHLCRQWIGEK